MTVWKKPCEKTKKGTRVCFWHEGKYCACYEPKAVEKFGERFPQLSLIEDVPLDHCEKNYIPVLGQDQYFQRNPTLMAYRQRKKKMKEEPERNEVPLF